MRNAWTYGLFLAVALGAATSVASRMKEFEPGPQLTAAELEEQRAAARNNIDAYGNDVPQQTRPFPWMAAGLALTAILVCIPFGLKMYADVSREVSGARAFGVPKRD